MQGCAQIRGLNRRRIGKDRVQVVLRYLDRYNGWRQMRTERRRNPFDLTETRMQHDGVWPMPFMRLVSLITWQRPQ